MSEVAPILKQTMATFFHHVHECKPCYAMVERGGAVLQDWHGCESGRSILTAVVSGPRFVPADVACKLCGKSMMFRVIAAPSPEQDNLPTWGWQCWACELEPAGIIPLPCPFGCGLTMEVARSVIDAWGPGGECARALDIDAPTTRCPGCEQRFAAIDLYAQAYEEWPADC